MDYQDNYELPDDEEDFIDFEALEQRYKISHVGTWKSEPSQLIAVCFQAVPVFRGFCDKRGDLIGRIPGRLEVFKIRGSQLIVILSLEKLVENESALAISIWKEFGQLATSVISVDCGTGVGDETAIWFVSSNETASLPEGCKELNHEIRGGLAAGLSTVAKIHKIECSIFRLTYHGYRPSIAGLLQLSAALPNDLEIGNPSAEEMRKAQTTHLVFDEAAALYL